MTQQVLEVTTATMKAIVEDSKPKSRSHTYLTSITLDGEEFFLEVYFNHTRREFEAQVQGNEKGERQPLVVSEKVKDKILLELAIQIGINHIAGLLNEQEAKTNQTLSEPPFGPKVVTARKGPG